MSDHNHRFATILARALAAAGVTHAVVAPGSRNTPLSMAFARETQIDDLSVLDERSGGFLAIGIARATGRPVAVTCTSGTAAAELHPAVLEAAASRIPLVVITADRPADLYDVGAPQTVDQTRIYGSAVRWSHDLEPVDGLTNAAVAALGARLAAESQGVPPGPVHLNARFREPLVPQGPPPPDPLTPQVLSGALLPHDDQIASLDDAIDGKRALLVCGPIGDRALAPAAAAFAAARQIPILADPLSGLRWGAHDRDLVVAGGDLLAAGGWLDKHPPQVIVRIGGLPTSKPLWSWMADHPDVDQILIDDAGWRDPLGTISTLLKADPAALLVAAAGGAPGADDWAARWIEGDGAARTAADAVIDAAAFPSEPAVARAFAAKIPADAFAWVGSSMPVRDVDTFAAPRLSPLHMFGHRGANGIDGLISAAVGSASTSGAPTYALTGDIGALHDLTAIATATRLGVDLTVVIVNNDGGGIFHYLPQIDFPDVFERHFGTPHGLSFAPIAESLGARTVVVERPEDLTDAIRTPPSGVTVVEVTTDRYRERELHRDVRREVARAL